jgi:hypothetical protein
MPASIFGSRFTGRREPAWHGLGTVFEDAPLASEAIVRSGMDYVVVEGSDYRESRDPISASRSVLYGERAAEKHRAFAECLKLAGLKA